MAAVRVKSVLGTDPLSPGQRGVPRMAAQASPIHAYAREGIVAHSVTVLHQMEVRAIVAGIALTCIGVALYLLLRHHSVIRNGPSIKTPDVRVREGMSAWEVVRAQGGVNRR